MRTATLLLALLAGTPALAQEAAPAPPPPAAPPAATVPPHLYKDPGLATVLGVLITGGGHFYAGETGTGLLLMGAGLAGMTYGYVATLSSLECAEYTCPEPDLKPLLFGTAVALGAWVYGVVDAAPAARRRNAANAVPPVALAPTVVGDRPGVYVAVRF